MANRNQNWEDLGRSVQNIIDQAVSSHDYDKLNNTIRQVVTQAVDLGSEAVRKVVDSTTRPVSAESRKAKTTVVVEKKNLPALYGNTNGKTAKGILKIVGGGVLSCLTFVLSIASSIVLVVEGAAAPILLSVGGLGAGVGLICSGVGNLQKVGRFKTYRKALGQKTYCALEKLARSVGKNVKFVRKELEKMIDEGLFLEGHIDNEGKSLIISDETYQYFEQSRLQLEQRRKQEAAEAQKPVSRHTPQVQEVLNRGNAFIAEIRRCNDAIPGEEISAKIDRMEMIVRKIFARAETNPEIVPDLKKMMDYYLPMTVKLLNAYADMDAQPVQGETILNSKREIEATLDTLNLAFEKLLDDLFADTAMDISTDISVLNTLLAQEGLTEDDFGKMKNQHNA